jgi:chromosome segregation ATPase
VDKEKELEEMKARLADAREALFINETDLKKATIENIALKNFIQTLYESCENVNSEEIELEAVIANLKDNIRVFSRAYFIRI